VYLFYISIFSSYDNDENNENEKILMVALLKNLERSQMKEMIVYHAVRNFREQLGYEHVAKVYADNNLTTQEKLDLAFVSTNSINNAWWNNDNVKKIVKMKAVRSTSVGDKISIDDETYVVDLVGFTKVNRDK
jgi:hypothetical protein